MHIAYNKRLSLSYFGNKGKGKMSSRKKKKQDKTLKKVLLVILIVLVSFLIVIIGRDVLKKRTETNTQSGQKISFPYELEDGKLIVNSLFQSSISNPDCNGEEGEDIASLEIKNASDEFLTEAQITVTLDDGDEIPFLVTNIPAGKTVWAYATDNTSISLDFVCNRIKCKAQFSDKMPVMAESVSYEVNETSVTLNNLTGNEISGLSVGCHCLFEDVFFGGLTYNYKIEELPANESITINAEDCYLGSAEVVCIQQK